MYCNKCGKEIPDDSLFCTYCGSHLEGQADTNNDVVDRSVSEEEELSASIDFSDSIKKTVDVKKEASSFAQKKEEPPIKSIDPDSSANAYDKEFSRFKNPGQNEKPNVRKTGKGTIAVIVILSIIILALAALSVFQYKSIETMRTENNKLTTDNTTLSSQNTVLQKNNQKLESDLKSEKAKLKAAQKFDGVADWLKKHGSEFNTNKKYRAATNVVVVRVGETYELEVTYVGDRWRWIKQTNRNINAEWSDKWSNNKTTVEITGKTAGTSEVIFSLGDKNKADTKESFRVLVIVVS